jgi:hypothetical protein
MPEPAVSEFSRTFSYAVPPRIRRGVAGQGYTLNVDATASAKCVWYGVERCIRYASRRHASGTAPQAELRLNPCHDTPPYYIDCGWSTLVYDRTE